MIDKRMARASAGAAALACGAVALLALAGCSSNSSGSAAAGNLTATVPSAAPSPSASAPSWASALGAGVTVVAPGSAAPGNDSPGGVMMGIIDAYDSKKFADMCAYMPPTGQSACKGAFSQGAAQALSANAPYARNPADGYVVIEGTKALVGSTGEYCDPSQSPKCFTNSDPAAIFTSGKSFASLWKTAVAQANASNSPNVYTLLPCVEIGGKWYADISFS
jgi:hypothetical protein